MICSLKELYVYTLFQGQRISFREYLYAFSENKRNFGWVEHYTLQRQHR